MFSPSLLSPSNNGPKKGWRKINNSNLFDGMVMISLQIELTVHLFYSSVLCGVDLALIQTSLLFLCKSCCCNANGSIYIRAAVRFVSKQGQLHPRFYSKAL